MSCIFYPIFLVYIHFIFYMLIYYIVFILDFLDNNSVFLYYYSKQHISFNVILLLFLLYFS